jgi:hypothetical protein
MATMKEQLQIARGALADIANSTDMTLELARKKAARIYSETAIACEYPTCVDDGPEGKCTKWLIGDCPGPAPR